MLNSMKSRTRKLHLVVAASVWTLLGAVCSPLFAQVTLGGGRGHLRLLDAEPVPAGDLYVNGFYSVYLKKVHRTAYGSTGEITGKQEELVSDHTVNLSLTLGLSRLFEIYAHAVPYQDNQQDLWGPVGDTRLGLKVHIPHQGHALQTGFAGFVHLPTAPLHNVPYESYSTGAYGWGLLGLATLDLRSSALALPFKISFNLGYRDLDWQDRYFSSGKDQLLAGFGFKIPVKSALVYWETTGEIFINQTDHMSLRQNLIRMSPGVRFVGPWKLIFDVAADLRMGNYRPDAAAIKSNPFLKEYAEWKIVLGVTYRAQLFNNPAPEERARTLYEEKEREKAEEIRKQREQINQELEELRKKVEQGQQQVPK